MKNAWTSICMRLLLSALLRHGDLQVRILHVTHHSQTASKTDFRTQLLISMCQWAKKLQSRPVAGAGPAGACCSDAVFKPAEDTESPSRFMLSVQPASPEAPAQPCRRGQR